MKFSKSAGAKLFSLFSFLILFILGSLVLFCSIFEQPVPHSILARISSSISTHDLLVTADSASFSLSRGVKIRNLRAIPRGKPGAAPVISASLVDARLNLFRIPWSRKSLLAALSIHDLKYPRLPEGYYIPDSIEFPGSPDFQERDSPVHIPLPEIDPFPLTLSRPSILSVEPRSVTVKSVSVSSNGLVASGIDICWKESSTQMSLLGHAALDLPSQRVHGEVRGFTRQSYIRPMLVALDITNSFQFIDAFTGIDSPIASSCGFNVNLRNSDLHLFLDLHPRNGKFNQIPFSSADGKLDIRVFVRDTFQNAKITVGPLVVKLADGSSMSGSVVYNNTNDVGFVDFDVQSSTSLSNALAVADVMTDGTLDCIAPSSNPALTLSGRLAVNPANARLNDLTGTIAFHKGSVFTVPLLDVSATYRLRNTSVAFSQCRARAPRGGSIQGDAIISVPGMKQDNASFNLNLSGKDLALNDLTDVFSIDAGERRGTVDARLTLSGPISSNCTARLNGNGSFSSRNGHLSQMKLFAGLTGFLAREIPGVASIVNQSDAQGDFSIENGVVRSSNTTVSGKTFSINLNGKFDIPQDLLDVNARLTLSRDDSFFAKLATPITWPFSNLTKILFDFRIHGPLDSPELDYNKNPIDRLR